MPQIRFGFWDGVVYDNRDAGKDDAPEELDLKQLEQFNEGNPVEVFLSNRGFLVFDENANLASAFAAYYKDVKDNSCGKCTPCRVGSRVISEALDNLISGQEDEIDWDYVANTAEVMRGASICGVGQTSPVPLLSALKHFREDLFKSAKDSSSHGYYSTMTAPCIEACPSKVNVPRYIDYVKDEQPELAAAVVLRDYPLLGSCGRVCVRFCEKACRRNELEGAVDIKNLKRYTGDQLKSPINEFFHSSLDPAKAALGKVAVIGAGPAGVTCAYHLLLDGHPVEIFEAHSRAGGMALYGIPEYRLPKDLLKSECDVIESLGGVFHYKQKLGSDYTIDDLFDRGFKAVFVATGCAMGSMLGFPEDDQEIPGYTSGLDFLLKSEKALEKGEQLRIDGDVVVVGGGNVAMDCCRTAKRVTDGKVTVVYRRTQKQAPADQAEIIGAEEEGVEFSWLTAQKGLVLENGRVAGLRCCKLNLEVPPEGGKGRLTEIPGSEFVIPCRHVIGAIGQKFDQSVFKEEEISLDRRGNIQVDADLRTSREGLFAGGDCATGAKTLVESMAQGKTAAKSIHDYLTYGEVRFTPRRRMSDIIASEKLLKDLEPCRPQAEMPRSRMEELEPESRANNFAEVEVGLRDDQAEYESNRCMRCYRLFAVTTKNEIPGTERGN